MSNEAALKDEADRFALDLMERLARIIPSGDLGFTCEAATTRSGEGHMAIASAVPGGIVLTIESEPRLQLQVDYKLILSPNSGRAMVSSSSFLVRKFHEPRPLFTIDYVREAQNNTPAAHYNFHFENDAIVRELMTAGHKKRGKLHRKEVDSGRELMLRALHFPVGGHRFRPCMEDVLDMLRLEFGIDVHEQTAQAAINIGRARFRETQVRAAVSDHLDSAAQELRRHGYIVTPPETIPPIRLDRLQAL